jgi:hypothetical protein
VVLRVVRGQMLDVMQASGLTLQHDRYVKGSDNQKLYLDLPNFISYRMSFGIVEFVHIPALDPIQANDLENPMIDGHRLSSYMFIIDDLSALTITSTRLFTALIMISITSTSTDV